MVVARFQTGAEKQTFSVWTTQAGNARYKGDADVTVITIDNPPVTPFRFDVRYGVIEAMDRAETLGIMSTPEH